MESTPGAVGYGISKSFNISRVKVGGGPFKSAFEMGDSTLCLLLVLSGVTGGGASIEDVFEEDEEDGTIEAFPFWGVFFGLAGGG